VLCVLEYIRDCVRERVQEVCHWQCARVNWCFYFIHTFLSECIVLWRSAEFDSKVTF
jgi:hypothetical protein